MKGGKEGGKEGWRKGREEKKIHSPTSFSRVEILTLLMCCKPQHSILCILQKVISK